MIKVGDMVVKVRACPGCNAGLGAVFTVGETFRISDGMLLMCRKCNKLYGETAKIYAVGEGKRFGAPVNWLMKIEPGALSEAERKEVFLNGPDYIVNITERN